MAMRLSVSVRCSESGCSSYEPGVITLVESGDLENQFDEVFNLVERHGWVICKQECMAICPGCWERSKGRMEEAEEEEEDRCDCESCRGDRGELEPWEEAEGPEF